MHLDSMLTLQMVGVLLVLSILLPFLGLVIIARGNYSACYKLYDLSAFGANTTNAGAIF